MNTHPRILVFIDWFLPGDKAGGPVRSLANMLDHMEGKADFYVITRNTDYCETAPYTAVPSNTWVRYNNTTHVWYASRAYQNLKGFRKIIRTISFDLIYLNGIYSLKFSILPLMLRFTGVKKPVLIAPRGMLAPSAIDIKSRQKKLFLRVSKYVRLHEQCFFHATNEKEKMYIEKHIYTNKKIFIAPNLPRRLESVNYPAPEKNVHALNLISIARIAPEKNTAYALRVLQHVPPGLNITFDLYGSVYNTEYYNQCLAIIEKLPDNIHINLYGPLEAGKVPERLAEAHALLLPTRGENFGHVILESLTVGTPVLISDQTPWQKLSDDQAGWDIPLENPEKFSDTINDLANLTQEKYTTLREKTRQYAQSYLKNNQAIPQTYEMLTLSAAG